MEKLTVCSPTHYDAQKMRTGNALVQWLEYHLLLGVDKFVLYDKDGSLGDVGVLDEYIDTGRVTYYPKWADGVAPIFGTVARSDGGYSTTRWNSAALPATDGRVSKR